MGNGGFGVFTAKQFFDQIEIVYRRLAQPGAKTVSDVFFVVFGLNHLREWIVPGYKYTKKKPSPPKTHEENFYVHIFCASPEYKTIKEVCNGLKHVRTSSSTSAQHGLLIDEWPDTDGVSEFDKGQPSGFSIDGSDIVPVLGKVIEFYRTWFNGSWSPPCSTP